MKSRTKKHADKRIVICGSMTFYTQMIAQNRILAQQGIPSIIPDADVDPNLVSTVDAAQEAKRRLSMRHIRRIRDTDTYGVLIINCDKHGIPNYIGPNTFAEVAVAVAHYKQVFLYQGIPDFYRDELTAWQSVPLYGDMSSLIRQYESDRLASTAQMDLFDELEMS